MPLEGNKGAVKKGSTVTLQWERVTHELSERKYMVKVSVGSRQKSAKSCNCHVRITGMKGSSDRLHLAHNFHDKNIGAERAIFPFTLNDIGDPMLVRIDAVGARWYIDSIEVSSHGKTWFFPFYGWLNKKQETAMLFEGSGSLPQHDGDGAPLSPLSGTAAASLSLGGAGAYGGGGGETKAQTAGESKGGDDRDAGGLLQAASHANDLESLRTQSQIIAHSGHDALKVARKLELAMRLEQYQWSNGRELYKIFPPVEGVAEDILVRAMPNYIYTEGHHSFNIPEDERFTGEKSFDFRKAFAVSLTNLALTAALNVFDGWNHINEHNALYHNCKKPRVARSWKEDREIGFQAVQGVAPNLIRRVFDGLPDKFPVTDDILQWPAGKMEREIAAKRLYWIDLVDCATARLPDCEEGAEPLMCDKERGQRYMAIAMVLFHVDPDRDMDLYPVAIQLGQDPSEYCIFTPHDSAIDWMVAKMYYKSAEYNLHQVGLHALRTHFAMEPPAVAKMRNMSARHPVYKLLHRHQRFTMEINCKARNTLICAGGPFDDFISIGGGQHIALAMGHYKASWDFVRSGLIGACGVCGGG